MKWKAKDPLRWNNKFAFIPRKVGNTWIWLQPYEQRIIKVDRLSCGPLVHWERRCGELHGVGTTVWPD